ncbi:MAG: PolC-type DNA polymerase III [Lachnospiraceae bacterium]|nr:PolC-type DNA polymerase III [Lachnospiraceae bacterium]
MAITFFEAFDKVKVQKTLEEIFKEVIVERVTVSKSSSVASVFILSKKIIDKSAIRDMENAINTQLFVNLPQRARIFERYEYSDKYQADKIMKIYSENIDYVMREQGNITYSIYKQSEKSYVDDHLVLICENSCIARAKSAAIKKVLENIFNVTFDYSIKVDFEFSKEVKRKQYEDIAYETVEGYNPEEIERKKKEKEQLKAEKKEAKAQKKSEYNNKAKSTKFIPKKAVPKDPSIFYGSQIEGELIEIVDIIDEIGKVHIRGKILNSETRELKNGDKAIISFSITDFTDSITGKIFVLKDEIADYEAKLKKGNFIEIDGSASYDKFVKEISIGFINGIRQIEDFTVSRMDNYEGEKRIELHAHTKMSDMDAVVDVKTLVKTAMKWGHKAVAVTDHGVVQAFPDANHAIEGIDTDFKVIYGVEAYLVDDIKDIAVNIKGQNLDDTCVVFDIETTGFGPINDQIIEIGAIKVKNGEIIDRYSTFINPLIPIPLKIEKLTGINDEMVKDARLISEVIREFLDFCEGCVLVAHNAGFDTGFIRKKAEFEGIKTDFTVVDTVAFARSLLPHLSNFKLDTVANDLNVSLENHHRAIDDATATAEIFLKLCSKAKEKGVNTLEELNGIVEVSPDVIKKMPTNHAIILAKNETGRVNLYRLVSKSHIDYFARRPRIPKSLFLENREGLIIGSACEAGELYKAILAEATDDELARLVNFYDYLEIQPLGNNMFMLESEKYNVKTIEDLQAINKKIVSLGEEYQKPVVATCDVHFLNPEDEVYRRIIMSGKGFKDADNQAPLYLRTTEEMLREFDYLGRDKAKEVVITNTIKISDMIEKISPVSPNKCPPVIENSDEELRQICYNKAKSMYGENVPEPVMTRLDHELNSIIKNGYSVMYIIAQKLVWKSVEDGYLVGSRGSVGSSFVATMSGITEVNPLPAHYYCEKCHYSDFDSEEVKKYSGSSGCDMPDKVCPVCGANLCKDGHDIPFETFLGFYGDKEPDIDLNFSGEYQAKAHAYTEVIFGSGQTFRAGTIGGVAEKTAYGYVKGYFADRDIIKRSCEIERISQGCVGVKRTTGQHPGGIVVLPIGEEIYTFTPVQRPANDMTTTTVTTHFDYHSIDHNLLKLDILGHDDPTMIRMLEDITGIDATTVPLDEQKVLSLFADTSALNLVNGELMDCDLGSLGVPEFGTEFVMQMLRDTKPKNFSDLVRISGLSHGTDVWLNNAQYYIAKGDCTLSTAICTRDDIMIYLIHMGVENGLAFKIMESVRKGKGLQPHMEEAMREANVPEWYIESCKKIKYMFPKAHAAAYVMMAFRIAYFKVYYPLAYYAAFFSIRAKAFNYELMCMGQEQLEKTMNDYKKRAQDPNPERKLSNKEEDSFSDMRIVQEMYCRGFEFMPIDLKVVKARHFQIIDGKLMPALSSIDGLGDKAADSIVEGVKYGDFLSKDDFKQRCKVSSTVCDTLARLGLLGDLPESNQISLMDMFDLG